jgi:hypothetical protein
LASQVTPRALVALRAVTFICVTGAAALILKLALFIALAASDDSSFEPTECEYDEVRCGDLMEFRLRRHVAVRCAGAGHTGRASRMARCPAGALMPTALDNGQRSPYKLLRKVVARLLGGKRRGPSRFYG